jgi:hypothetical protein
MDLAPPASGTTTQRFCLPGWVAATAAGCGDVCRFGAFQGHREGDILMLKPLVRGRTTDGEDK